MAKKEAWVILLNNINHCMDGAARLKDPGLTEEQRFQKALELSRRQGVTEITSEMIEKVIQTSSCAHINLASRSNSAISKDQVERANGIVSGLRHLFK